VAARKAENAKLDAAAAARRAGHKLIRQGKGEHTWGECACGQWAWMGTYEMPKGKLAKLRAAYAQHIQHEAEATEGAAARRRGEPYVHEMGGAWGVAWLTVDSELKANGNG
jgi:hypothetical protein